MRRNAMKAFQETSDETKSNKKNEARVILLSLESAASGANLNKATHVILVGMCHKKTVKKKTKNKK